MPKPVKVQCTHCGGSGLVELTGVYAETLALLARHSDRNGAELARLAGCQETAMNNRLVALQRMGLAYGRKYGRSRLWRRQTTD